LSQRKNPDQIKEMLEIFYDRLKELTEELMELVERE